MADEADEKPGRRGYLPADPKRNETLAHIGLPNVSIYRAEDLISLRSAIKRATLSPETILRLQEELAMAMGDPTVKIRQKVSIGKVLFPLWVSLQKLLKDMQQPEAAQQPTSVTNQQINIYLPDNGRAANGTD